MPLPTPRSFQHYRARRPAEGSDPFALRVNRLGGDDRSTGSFVLYWSQSARRMKRNLALDYAITEANRLRLPVVIYESLRPDYPSANVRIHTFVLQGVEANRRDAQERGLRYVFPLPATRDEARGLLRRVSADARLIVTDEFPTFIARAQTERFASRSRVPVVTVDNNGILPMRSMPAEQYSARFFRERAHRLFSEFWMHSVDEQPAVGPFTGPIDADDWRGDEAHGAAQCAIEQDIPPVATAGGRDQALALLDRFVRESLDRYADDATRSCAGSSGLSPYLHFGSIGIDEVAERVLESDAPGGSVDAFLEQAIIRRELSFNLCFFRPDHDRLSVLPDWAARTLHEHRDDRRKPVYAFEQLEQAATGDEVWNLAQRALLRTGTIHNYLRMVWGKKIIEWSETPEAAHRTMLQLHERWAIDGRDPNTHAGVLWCFGKHDRPWGPERPIFGTVRYMSSEATARKVDLAGYARMVDG